MKVSIQQIDSFLTDPARQRIRRRIQKLADYGVNLIEARATLKKDNQSPQKAFHADIQLVQRGHDLVARSKGANPEEAVSGAVESLRKRIRKKKTTRLAKRRKGI